MQTYFYYVYINEPVFKVFKSVFYMQQDKNSIIYWQLSGLL